MQFIRLEYGMPDLDGQVKTDALSRFSRTAMLTHDSLEIRIGRKLQARVCDILPSTTAVFNLSLIHI